MAAAVAVAVGDIPAPPSSCLDILPKTGAAAKFWMFHPEAEGLYMTCILVHFSTGSKLI